MKPIYLIYITIVALYFVSCFLIFTHKRMAKRRTTLILIAGAICVTLVYMAFPLSNLFTQFNTPYGAYCAMQEGDKALVIEGKDSALVVATESTSSAYNVAIIPEGKTGWKVPGVFDSRTISNKLFPDLTLEIQQARNTNDFYISIYSIGAEIDVLDSNNSVFHMLDSNKSSRGTIYAYYAWVDSLDETYSVMVNGNRIY